MSYQQFLEAKKLTIKASGFEPQNINPILFDFQRDIVRWACKKGKSCIFAGTGLGKSFMQIEWARLVQEHTGENVLIVAPLAVSTQTIKEAAKIGITVHLCKEAEDVNQGINITNYERLERFDDVPFGAVVLDESSILKNQTGKTRNAIIERFAETPYKLACTATPAPNDYMELGNHAEFVGVMTQAEMLAMFFVHDGGETAKWRIKRHAVERFWQWVAGWAVMVTKPSDLGYENGGFDLPPLRIHQVTVESMPIDTLFAVDALTLIERRAARKESTDERVQACADIANQTAEPWLVWCNMNEESVKLTKAINGAVEITGSDSPDKKESAMNGFSDGLIQKIVTKASIAGHGMNWQHCNKMAFVGLSDSFEEYYQAVRRCWRFGQERPVDVYVITSEAEGAVVENIKRKERDFEDMLSGMISATQEITKENLKGTIRDESDYEVATESGDGFTMMLGDCVDRLTEVASDSVGYSIFSPPFASLYTYSNSDRDMGNCKSHLEFARHFRFLCEELHRVIMPGRCVSIHCMDLPRSKEREGVIGIRDFRGALVRQMERVGFILHSQVTIWKDPVIAMQRTKAIGLLHKQLKKDSTISRQGIPDYLVTFRKRGENPEPVFGMFDNYAGVEQQMKERAAKIQSFNLEQKTRFSIDTWQRYASPVWMDINPSDTLQRESAREEADERHICPLQLDVIERGLQLWSNPGDVVLSPFGGIGSEGYKALKCGRKFIGIELKKSYWMQACANLRRAATAQEGISLFDDHDADSNQAI